MKVGTHCQSAAWGDHFSLIGWAGPDFNVLYETFLYLFPLCVCVCGYACAYFSLWTLDILNTSQTTKCLVIHPGNQKERWISSVAESTRDGRLNINLYSMYSLEEQGTISLPSALPHSSLSIPWHTCHKSCLWILTHYIAQVSIWLRYSLFRGCDLVANFEVWKWVNINIEKRKLKNPQ